MRSERIGCLLIGEVRETRLEALAETLGAKNVLTGVVTGGEDLLLRAQEGLCRVRPGSDAVCVVAEGAMWPVALALSVQLGVDRIVLIEPALQLKYSEENMERQIERLKAYVRRNLFFCVSEVLIAGSGETDARCRRKIEAVWRRLSSAKLHRTEKTWTNCEYFINSEIVSFLLAGEFAKLLAK